jgi:hypothetical protein
VNGVEGFVYETYGANAGYQIYEVREPNKLINFLEDGVLN